MVEAMVALVAGLLLSAGIGQVYLATKKTYTVQEQLSRLQENARYAIDRMSRDIRMAGSMGCTSRAPITIINTLNVGGDPFYNFGFRIDGYEAHGTAPTDTYALDPSPTNSSSSTKWIPTLPAALPEMIPGNDVLMLHGRTDTGVADLLQAADPNTVTVNKSNPNSDFQQGDLMMVSDCSASFAFQASSVGGDPGGNGIAIGHAAGNSPGNAVTAWNATKTANIATLQNPHGSIPAEAYKIASTLYYLYLGTNDTYPSLYRKSRDSGTNTPSESLVEGVENMQILYGWQDGDGNVQYGHAALVADWNQVVSVRIALLMRSLDDGIRKDLDTQIYNLNGTKIDPVDDHRLRQVFTATIAVRNGI